MKLVITGQPKSGKTTLSHILECEFGRQIALAEDPIDMLRTVHFPMAKSSHEKKIHQKAHYFLQIELEEILSEKFPDRLMICDHGTIDCLASWPGTAESFFSDVGSTLKEELARYDWVIQVADPEPGSRGKAAAGLSQLDPQQYWKRHAHIFTIPVSLGFSAQVSMAASIVKEILSKHPYQEIISQQKINQSPSYKYGPI